MKKKHGKGWFTGWMVFCALMVFTGVGTLVDGTATNTGSTIGLIIVFIILTFVMFNKMKNAPAKFDESPIYTDNVEKSRREEEYRMEQEKRRREANMCVISCPSCGANVKLEKGTSGICEYCKSSVSDEKK